MRRIAMRPWEEILTPADRAFEVAPAARLAP